jgi:hypothetical protein
MSGIFNSQSNNKPNTWVAWFILGICLTVVMKNPLFLILGTSFAVVHKHLYR